MRRLVTVLATCMSKPSQIKISCDSEFYWRRPVGYEKMWSVHSGSHVTLSASADFLVNFNLSLITRLVKKDCLSLSWLSKVNTQIIDHNILRFIEWAIIHFTDVVFVSSMYWNIQRNACLWHDWSKSCGLTANFFTQHYRQNQFICHY